MGNPYQQEYVQPFNSGDQTHLSLIKEEDFNNSRGKKHQLSLKLQNSSG